MRATALHSKIVVKGRKSARKIALAGNPNVGKSVIFNKLTGAGADVSNYPGTTIDVAHDTLGDDLIVDTPGVYGISSFNDEERIARAEILAADIVINVVSALSLDRDLFLTLQLIDMGLPMVLVINQCDEAENRGIKIDIVAMEELLGLPVIRCVAVEGRGIGDIVPGLQRARRGRVNPALIDFLQPYLDRNISQGHALLMLEGDETTATELGLPLQARREEIYRSRRALVNEIVAQIVSQNSVRQGWSMQLGRLLLHPSCGCLVAVAVCYLIFYQLLGVWIAGDLVNVTEKTFMRGYYEPAVKRMVATIFPVNITAGNTTIKLPRGAIADPENAAQLDKHLSRTPAQEVVYDFYPRRGIIEFLGNALAGEYGLLTLTVTYLVGLLLPLVFGFYLGLSLLEDSGYLPRLAVLVDRVLSMIGLNGRAIIPLILGLGCVTMATITTRLLSSRREKLIATALLGVAIPCSAQLGVVSGTLAHAGGILSWLIYGFVVFGILGLTGYLLNRILPGQSTGLMIDLPPMRLPRWDNVLKKTWKKSFNFLQDAVPMFCLAGFVVTVAQVAGILDGIIALLQPITVSWLHLPDDARIATTFILGIVRRDFAAFGLTDVALTPAQAVTAMVVITLFVPCIASVGVMMKERGAKVALAIWIGSWIAAFAVGGVLARALPPVFAVAGC